MAEVEGEEEQMASRLSAAGTLASSAGNMASTYGRFKYPTTRGSAGVGF
jgi:hypothetical protein